MTLELCCVCVTACPPMRRLLSLLNVLYKRDQEGGEEVIAAAASVVVVAVLSCARDQQCTLHWEAYNYCYIVSTSSMQIL